MPDTTISPSTESIHAFFAACPEMLFVAGLDGELQHCSEAMRDALGLAPDLKSSLRMLAHPDDGEAVASALARLRLVGQPVQLDVRLRDGRGGYVAVSCNARRASAGDALYGSLRLTGGVAGDDIWKTRLKATLLDCIADQIDIGVWAINAEGTFLYHDGKGVEQAGVKRGQLLGMNVFDVYAADPLTISTMKRAIAGEEVHSYPEGHGMHWETWCSPVRGSDGRVAMVAGLTLNITDRRKAEDELRVRLMQIEKQQEVIRDLSTPIIEVWDGVLTLPLVGIVDSIRTADVMDALLTRIVDTHARFAILDLTGVDMVDSRVAGHVVKLVAAIRLLGAEGIVAGIKPNVAQAMVALGLDLSQIPTQRNLRAALAFCLRLMNPGPA